MGETGEKDEKMMVDTDIFIDFLRGYRQAIEYIKANNDAIIFSAITEAELLSADECVNGSDREKILHFLSQFEKIPVDNPLVQIAADFRRRYKIALPDSIIAASAFIKGTELITRNSKDFEKIKEITVKKPY